LKTTKSHKPHNIRPPQKKARLEACEPEEIAEASEVEEIIEAESDEDDLEADVTFVDGEPTFLSRKLCERMGCGTGTFRFMGIVGVKEEISMACGRVTHRLAPGIGYRKQRGRDGREYVAIDYRKSQAPVMLRGIQATCAELGHVFETEDGEMCICGRVRELMRAIRQ